MHIERTISITKHNRSQRITCHEGSQISGCRYDSVIDAIILFITVDLENTSPNSVSLQVRASRSEATALAQKTQGLELIGRHKTPRGDVFVYTKRERRHANDFIYHQMRPGIDLVELQGDAFVNIACPVRFYSGQPKLIYRSNLRKKPKTGYIIMFQNADLNASDYLSAAKRLEASGRAVEVPVNTPGWTLYVDVAFVK